MQKNNILIFCSGLLAFVLFFSFSIKSAASRGHNLDLSKSYETYKRDYMSKDGRIMDPERNNATTSEGQSYMMFMSKALDDKKTFDLVYTWTKNNLARKDGLFSWLWGEDKNGKYQILDYNSASDADIDIAFCLITAYEKWNDKNYLKEALPIIQAIWKNETKRIGRHLVLMPGVEQTKSQKIEVNPSYFSPYSFRIFQKYDKEHNWMELVDSSYYYLKEVTSKTKTGLPPNWFLIDTDGNGTKNNEKNEGVIIIENSTRGDFSYDAIRVFMRIFADYRRTGEKRAVPILEKSRFFANKWKKTENIYTNYQADGQLRDKDKFIGSIAILVPVINLYDKRTAASIYAKELSPNFNDKGEWDKELSYYGRNLLWFGEYMYKKKRLLK